MSQVFISHVEEDEAVALEIARGLEAAGYRTWYYERDADPGPSYLLQVNRSIERSHAIVIVISHAAVRSNQMTVEVVRGHESGKAFLPVRSGILHAEFQQLQPEWRVALGASASLAVPPEGVAAVIPRLVRGLQGLGIEPDAGGDSRRQAPEVEVASDRARREAEQRRRDEEFADFGNRLESQLDRGALADALATAEAMLRLRPGDPNTLATRAFITERLARAGARRGPLEVLYRLGGSTKRLALVGGGLVVALGFVAALSNMQFGDGRGVGPGAPPVPSAQPIVPASTPEPVVPTPPPNAAVPDRPPPAPAEPVRPRRSAAYSTLAAIGHRPTVVQVFDPT